MDWMWGERERGVKVDFKVLGLSRQMKLPFPEVEMEESESESRSVVSDSLTP